MSSESGPAAPHPSDTSAELIRRIKELSRTDAAARDIAWTDLERRYRVRLMIYASSRLDDKLRRLVGPEDVVNDAWMRAIRHWDVFEYRGPKSLYFWLALQVRRTVADLHRQEERRGTPLVIARNDASTPSHAEPQDSHSGPSTVAGRREMKDIVLRALDLVPVLYRRVLLAIEIQHRPRVEVEAEFGLPPGTLSSQLKRGREHWQRAIEGLMTG